MSAASPQKRTDLIKLRRLKFVSQPLDALKGAMPIASAASLAFS
jgi:hypothetical protein